MWSCRRRKRTCPEVRHGHPTPRPCWPRTCLQARAGLISLDIVRTLPTGCILKGETQKNPLCWFGEGGIFSGAPVFSDSMQDSLSLKFSGITDSYKYSCRSICLCNAPSLQSVEIIQLGMTEEHSDTHELIIWERKNTHKKKHVNKIFTGLSRDFGGGLCLCVFSPP